MKLKPIIQVVYKRTESGRFKADLVANGKILFSSRAHRTAQQAAHSCVLIAESLFQDKMEYVDATNR